MKLLLGSILLSSAAVVSAMPHVDHSGMFVPLHCNMMLGAAPCVSFSDLNYDTTQKVEIECGTCVIMDASGDLNLEKGLDVVGKLVFPASRQALKITTPFVFVQGEMIVEELADKKMPQPDKFLEFHFVGTEDVVFTSYHNQTFDKCMTGCNQSKKPFIVAGGKVDFQGMHESCHTWSRLQSVTDAGAPDMTAVAAPVAPTGCSSVLVDESFDVEPADWDGINAQAAVENGYYRVSDRPSGYTGPRVHLPIDCISPNKPYLLKFRFRYHHTSTNETRFVPPYIKMIQYFVSGGNSWISAPDVYNRGQMQNAEKDVWHEMQYVLKFDDIMADSTQTSDLTMYISPMNNVDTIDIDDFLLELAPSTAFEGRSCYSLLMNGKADISEHAYPFYPTGGVLDIASGTGPTGTNYFRSSLRSSTWSSTFSQDIAPECLVKTAVYDFSAYVRVDSSVEREVSVALLVDGTEHVIVICPPSSNDWVHCTAKIRLEEDVEGANEAILYTRVLGDDTSPLDIADVSLDYLGGRAEKLTLEDALGVSECWGPGAEVLVTSHTIQYEDSQVATIASVDANGVITLVDPIHKPITAEDDRMTAVEVAILSRNILFTAAKDDVNNPLHGGHFIIMHTSAPVVQKVVGVESHGFGQQGLLGMTILEIPCTDVDGRIVAYTDS